MKKLRRLSVIMLLVCSVFMTGCDASQIVEVIGKIAQGVQQAMPAIKNVVDTFSNIFGNDNNNNNNNAAVNNANNNNQQNTEANNNSQANVVTVDPNAEDVTGNTGNNANKSTESVEEIIRGAQIAVPYGQVGTENTTAAAAQIKAKYGITMLDGKSWKDEWNSATADKWTQQQLAQFAAIMEKLPAGFRGCTKGFAMQKDLRDNDGNEAGGLGGDPIMISSKAVVEEGWTSMASLVVHEMTHQVQAKQPDVLRQWAAKFWPNGKLAKSSITDYGNTDAGEDMAECVAEYFTNPEKMRQHDPERYDFIKNNIWK
ncbi:MAG: hypothetical protein CVV41_11780 [Candidatus Riflebacteria bacterium HGW-Riflebacteria-1]|jgi:hypothetical protein|nr:MAG: hypothetical protein CVV41_11780 [Candidatus Riflebacteria bacterium HGW-Riflebacteria-1]